MSSIKWSLMRPLMLLLVLCCLAASTNFEAFASPSSSTAGNGFDIQVDSSSGKITIGSGLFPNLSGDLSSVQTQVADKVVSKTKFVAQTVTAVCAIVCMVFFFINVTKLATSGSISFQRRAAIIGILWSGAALALFGGAWVVVSFFWNFLIT